jgi:hypothetical protein
MQNVSINWMSVATHMDHIAFKGTNVVLPNTRLVSPVAQCTKIVVQETAARLFVVTKVQLAVVVLVVVLVGSNAVAVSVAILVKSV